MNYYAINYPCGVASSANTGDRFGTYYRFGSKAARQKWIDGGGDFRSSRNYREPIPARDAELRRATHPSPSGYSEIADGDQELAHLQESAFDAF